MLSLSVWHLRPDTKECTLISVSVNTIRCFFSPERPDCWNLPPATELRPSNPFGTVPGFAKFATNWASRKRRSLTLSVRSSRTLTDGKWQPSRPARRNPNTAACWRSPNTLAFRLTPSVNRLARRFDSNAARRNPPTTNASTAANTPTASPAANGAAVRSRRRGRWLRRVRSVPS